MVMPSRAIKDLHPDLQRAARRFRLAMLLLDTPILITSTFRTLEEQQALYNQGRTEPGRIVTRARPRQSAHNAMRKNSKGAWVPAALAFDVVFGTRKKISWEGPWELLGEIAEKCLGLAWGGRWQKPDRPHFTIPNWKDVAEDEEWSTNPQSE